MTLRLLIISSILSLAGCVNPIASATRTPKPLSYVGTVMFGQPIADGRHLLIPLRYSDGDWVINSVQFPYAVDAQVDTGTSEFTVIFAVAGSERKTAGYELRLPNNLKGQYRMVYRDPDGARHPLQEIDLK